MYTTVNENTSFLLIGNGVQHIVTPSYAIYSNTLSYGYLNGCPLLVGNDMLIFGGGNDQREIAELYSWGSSMTRRIGSLLFQFTRGTCLYKNEMFYFCFGDGATIIEEGATIIVEEKTCRHRYLYHTSNLCLSTLYLVTIWLNMGYIHERWKLMMAVRSTFLTIISLRLVVIIQ